MRRDADEPNTCEVLQSAYDAYKSDLWLRRVKLGCLLTLGSIPSGVLLDMYVYPDLVPSFLIIRLVAGLVVAGVLGLLYTQLGRRYAQVFGLLWVLITVSHISVMILYSQGVTSPYYIGILLLMMGSCLLVPWSFLDCLQMTILALVIYALSCWGNYLHPNLSLPPPANPLGLAINNSFFMVLFSVICLISSYVAENVRFREFQLRFDLDQKKKELETSYAKLAELDRAKTQFFANISHELRTPLTLIVSPLDQLRSTLDSRADPKLRETLDIMYSNALRLLSLINDLLDLVRLEDGRLSLKAEPLDLKELLLGLVASMKGAAERAELTLETHFDDQASYVIAADKDRMEKVFINLLFNAIKFTQAGGTVRVRAQLEPGNVAVAIQDTGIGIAEDKLAAVFTRFWQEDGSSTRTRQGTGIGLALAKELVELHQGSITVESRKGVGSTFTVRLPRQEGLKLTPPETKVQEPWVADLFRRAQQHELEISNTSPVPSVERGRSKHKHTLLVVEDEPAMQRFLALELKDTYNVVVASDGLAGYEAALEHQPKLIITDMMLPKLDGISLCKKLKAAPNLLPGKIILLTAKADDRTKIVALEAGADDFVTKPFSTVELKTRLANLLLTAQLERELQGQNQVLEATLKQLQTTEAQLIQSERLSALGNLSAGIMHEINNPINFMVTAVHYLKGSIRNASPDVLEAVSDIEGGLTRVKDIIADLKGFAYGGNSTTKKACDPTKLVRTAKRLLAHDMKDNVKLEESVQPDVPVWANENQLVQLLVNLLQNALHATQNNPSQNKPRLIKISLAPQDQSYVISVRDNGVGIKKENLAKLFDPFFTTKAPGEGMGLGLSISHTIVKQHHGEINVQSEYGSFTEFIVRLPLTQEAPETLPLEVG